LNKDDFLVDKRIRQALIMSLVIVGEIIAKKNHGPIPGFSDQHRKRPWRYSENSHGYCDVNLDVVWDTVQTAYESNLQSFRRRAAPAWHTVPFQCRAAGWIEARTKKSRAA
jgi:uncharacterized protein with HEPN domain